jgi:hypothetical protein
MPWIAALLLFGSQLPSVADLGWLSGAWAERKAGGEWTEEYWTPPRGGLMIGAGLTGSADTVRHFEHMRIVTDASGKVAFHAMPNGGPAVVFPVTRWTADEISFENPANDYPQRVTYRREGDRIAATISMLDGSRENRWVYTRPSP